MKYMKKTRALIAACLLLCVFVISLSGCSLEGLTGISSFIPEKQVGYYINGEKTEIELPDDDRGYFAELSADQKMIYAAAIKAIELGENSFICGGVDYEEYLEVYGEALTALLYDRPEYFWISGEAVASAEYIEGTDYGNVKIELSIYDYWWEADLFAAQDEFNAAVDDIVAEASALGSDYDKVKYVHDLLIKNVSYDYDSYNAGSRIDAESEAVVNTAYGALIEGRAMCGGYARAFGLIMKKLGIESMYVTGTADGGPHAWNMIKLDGNFYHIDLTWDDADGEPCEILYSYFCVTDEEIFKTHLLDSEFNYMTASANEYNYYIREGLYLDRYSFSAVNEMMKNYDGDALLTFKCASYAVFKAAVEDLITEHRLYELEGMSELNSYSYATDEAQYILIFLYE